MLLYAVLIQLGFTIAKLFDGIATRDYEPFFASVLVLLLLGMLHLLENLIRGTRCKKS